LFWQIDGTNVVSFEMSQYGLSGLKANSAIAPGNTSTAQHTAKTGTEKGTPHSIRETVPNQR